MAGYPSIFITASKPSVRTRVKGRTMLAQVRPAFKLSSTAVTRKVFWQYCHLWTNIIPIVFKFIRTLWNVQAASNFKFEYQILFEMFKDLKHIHIHALFMLYRVDK